MLHISRVFGNRGSPLKEPRRKSSTFLRPVRHLFRLWSKREHSSIVSTFFYYKFKYLMIFKWFHCPKVWCIYIYYFLSLQWPAKNWELKFWNFRTKAMTLVCTSCCLHTPWKEVNIYYKIFLWLKWNFWIVRNTYLLYILVNIEC